MDLAAAAHHSARSERAVCPRSLLPPLELPRIAADESLDSAARAFLVNGSLEQQMEMDEEEEVPEELYSQRASLQRCHSGEWSSLGMGTAKRLRSLGKQRRVLGVVLVSQSLGRDLG